MDQKYTHANVEAEIKEFWAREKVFNFTPGTKPVFSVDTPPPTVSGSIHIGHIFSYTQTDIIARFSRFKNFEVFYPFGFDDNGLATERFVEKKREVNAFSTGRSAFIKVCLEETHLAEQQFKDLWQSIGLSVDWNLAYSTIEPRVQRISQESFIDLYKKGLIYRKNEPALYCTTCRTSVAQAELDDKDVNSVFNDLVFTITDGQKLTVGTTRPELLASCVALLYHPSDARYKNLDKQQAIVPLYEHKVRIIADELVDPQKGTGLVMCCTFGDKNDIAWYQKYNLEYRASVGRDGVWTPLTGILAGLRVHAARKKMILALQELGVLVNQKQITHAVNIHERCKDEIEYLILPQWFLNILGHKKEFLAAADQINWYPAYMKTRYTNWVEGLGWDWCLSRQRFYGIPFPAWHCTACNTPILAELDQLPVDPQETPYGKPCPHCGAQTVEADTDVMDTWNTSSLTPYICHSLVCGSSIPLVPSDRGAIVSRDEPKNPARPELVEGCELKSVSTFLPMSMRPQAHDIIRTWTFYTIVKAWFHNQTIPWKSVVISGHTLSAKSEKISKSQNNAPIAPTQLVHQWSADALRFWTASAALGTNVAFSENQFKIGQRLVTKLWNAFLFVGQHAIVQKSDEQNPLVPSALRSFGEVGCIEGASSFVPPNLGPVNEWLLHRATETFNNYTKELEQNEFSPALGHIERFFWKDLCDNYLEIVKDQLFHPENYSPETVAATKWTLYWVGLRVLQLYAPFIPFVTEKIYQELYRPTQGSVSLHKTSFDAIQHQYSFAESVRVMELLLGVITQVRTIKTANKLSLGTPLQELVLYSPDAQIRSVLELHKQVLFGVCKTSSVRVSDTSCEIGLSGNAPEYRMSVCVETQACFESD